MSGNAKLTLTPAVDAVRTEFRWREPVDLADVCRLIGDAKDPIAGARLYSDAVGRPPSLCWHIASTVGTLSSCRPKLLARCFDELAKEAFADSDRERGHLLLSRALLKAASIIGEPAVRIEPEIETVVPVKNRLVKALNDERKEGAAQGGSHPCDGGGKGKADQGR